MGQQIDSSGRDTASRLPLRGCLAALIVFLLAASASAQERLVAGPGAPIRYLANSSDPGVGMSWVAEGFDDSAWDSGQYGVGYEAATGAEDLIATPVPTDAASVFTRLTFDVPNAAAVTSLFAGADYDDAWAVWLNGIEIYRSPELPAGALDWNTPPALHESSNNYDPIYGPLVDLSTTALPLLQSGTNSLAIAVWNGPLPSTDLVLIPQIVLNKAESLVRGPYLQAGTPSAVTLRWRTDTQQTSRVVYGLAPDALDTTVEIAPQTAQDHEIELTGLTPATRYYYAIGNSTDLFVGAEESYSFVTAPPVGDDSPIRIWAIGDSGSGDRNARAVRGAYETFAGSDPTDLWLMLGDNAYPNGTDAEYQIGVFDVYGELLRGSVLWPTIGNHDANTSVSPTETGPYFDIFTLPTAGQAGGVGSGTEAYYSFDHGNVHFVVLDSADTDRAPTGDMLDWLAQDLADTLQDWIVAYWHHPPYSRGSHNSDNEIELQEMRQNALPVLEAHGVDLVLCGHSHSYERSFLIDGHYGDASTFGPGFVLDGGDGSQTGDGVYAKPTLGSDPHQGAVYTVAGNAGSVQGGPLDHPAMYVSMNVLGSLVIDVERNRLDVRMLGDTGSVLDEFTLIKGPYCLAGTDADEDGICDAEDNCPATANTDQLDTDADGDGDVCDVCPTDPGNDDDADGLCFAADNCPDVTNPAQQDTDADGTGDVCDACPFDPDDDADDDLVCGD
ncbi:MAG: hypothetical protein GY716_12935, partial [bacterium]|nr:hypothetical protein [bacterium]